MGYLKNLFKALFNRKEKTSCNYSMSDSMNRENDNYLIDFNNRGFLSVSGMVGNVVMDEGGYNDSGKDSKPPKKMKVKPKDILDELERTPTMWSLENIDDKILIMKDRVELTTQSQTRQELNDLIGRLENRKKLRDKDSSDKKTFQSYFNQFDTTNDEKIQKLLKKYDIVMKSADIFIPEFPDEAIKIMKQFSKKVEKITGKKPIYYVIATNDNFEEVYEKRDPILLAQSPFGIYYYILGAWDTEMLYLPEL